MEITESIIQKFFDGQCTAAEAEAVAGYLQRYPEVLDNRFNNEWVENKDFSLSGEEYSAMLQNIQQQIGSGNRRSGRIYRMMAVAASVLVVIAAGYLFFLPGKSTSNTIPEQAAAKTSGTQWKMKTNITASAINVTLEDNSVIRLQPSAFIKYPGFAGKQTRNIYLSGEACFTVAKDKTKPFTVFAGAVATTAVGTRFNVQEKMGRVTVQLYEGKVKIAVTAQRGEALKKNLYLEPGQQFMYDSLTASFMVSRIEKTRKPVKENAWAAANTRATSPAANSVNWYMFNNQALPNVFEQLEELYNVKIIYDKGDFRNVYFIGKFEKTDSLDHVLNTIALLKKLKVHHKGNKYVISKKTP